MKKYSVNIEDLLQDGFSHKFATYYLSLVEKEINNPYYDAEYVDKIHSGIEAFVPRAHLFEICQQ